jgi:hypothetical protein
MVILISCSAFWFQLLAWMLMLRCSCQLWLYQSINNNKWVSNHCCFRPISFRKQRAGSKRDDEIGMPSRSTYARGTADRWVPTQHRLPPKYRCWQNYRRWQNKGVYKNIGVNIKYTSPNKWSIFLLFLSGKVHSDWLLSTPCWCCPSEDHVDDKCQLQPAGQLIWEKRPPVLSRPGCTSPPCQKVTKYRRRP